MTKRRKAQGGTPSKPMVTIEQAMLDANLLGAGLGDPSTWKLWLTVLKAAFAIALTPEEAQAFAAVAGGRKPPTQRAKELWCVLGRRSGKSRMAAALAVYFAVLVDHTGKLAPGEVGYVYTLASTRDQAKAIRNYAEGFLRASPILSTMIEEVTAEEIRLRGGIVIAVHPSNFRSVRGRSLLACVFDEVSFWRSEESAQPDLEVYRAVLPALSTTGGMLVAISSPYRRVGILHQKHRDFFGKDDDRTLVIQGESRTFNPLLDEELIRRAKEEDPEAATSEWDGDFRSDLTQFLDDAVIDAAIDYGRPLELPPRDGLVYRAFADASAGRHDAFTFGIGHREDGRIIADVIRGRRPPFDPATVAAEFAALAKEYRCTKVIGDNFSGEWVAQAFKTAGVEYARSELAKSALYLEALPYFMRGAISIPNVPILIRELRLLERRVGRSGKDSVDHGASGSDDHANVLAGIMWLLRDVAKREMYFPPAFSSSGGSYFGSFDRGGFVAAGRFDGGSGQRPGGEVTPENEARRAEASARLNNK
jgi:hypothetical protein